MCYGYDKSDFCVTENKDFNYLIIGFHKSKVISNDKLTITTYNRILDDAKQLWPNEHENQITFLN